MGNKKGQEAFARRFQAVLDAAFKYRGWTQREIAKRIGQNPNLVTNYKDKDYASGPPKKAMQARIEHALGLPPGTLSRDNPADLEALRNSPGLTGAGTVGGKPLRDAAVFVAGQLQVYQRANLPVPPQIVTVLLAELESAMGEGPSAGGGDGVRSGNGPPEAR